MVSKGGYLAATLLGGALTGFLRGRKEAQGIAREEKRYQSEKALKERALGLKGDDLSFRKTSTARGQDLRERDLGLKEESERGRNRRFDVGQTNAINQTLARPMAQYAPGAAAAVFGLDPEYGAQLEEAGRIARDTRRRDEAGRAGARAGTASAARNEQTRRMREQQRQTTEAMAGRGEMPKKPFYPGTAGRPSSEKLEDASISTEKALISHVLRLTRAGEDVPAGMQQAAVRARAKQRGISLETLTPEQAGALEDEIAQELGLVGE